MSFSVISFKSLIYVDMPKSKRTMNPLKSVAGSSSQSETQAPSQPPTQLEAPQSSQSVDAQSSKKRKRSVTRRYWSVDAIGMYKCILIESFLFFACLHVLDSISIV